MPFEGEHTAPRVIRDPIYGYISVDERLAPVVDHPLVQRLRRVGQTSLTSTVYPSATGSRFEHALGTMHLAGWGWEAACRNSRPGVLDAFRVALQQDVPQLSGGVPLHEIQETCHLAVSCVGLLHDVGHPPFSHVLEGFFAEMAEEHLGPDASAWDEGGQQFHEFVGKLLTQQVLTALPEPLRATSWAVYQADPDGFSWASALHAIIAGEIDVDRIDYLMRDAQKAGTEFGELDYRRLIDALELHRRADDGFRIAPGIRARSAVETLLLQRSQSYKWITYHPRVVGSNRALAGAARALRGLAGEQSIVRLEGSERRLGGFFAPVVSLLNYVQPTERQTLEAVGLADPGEPDQAPGQLALTEQDRAQLAERLSEEVQASIDDATVVRNLQQGALRAQALLEAGTTNPQQREQLERFVTLVRAALYRSKNYLPAWKTVEGFSVVSEQMREALQTAVQEGFVEARRRVTGEVAREELVHREERLTDLLSERPVAGVNHFFQKLLAHERYRAQLVQELDGELTTLGSSTTGFWDLVLTSFRPLRIRGQLAGLYNQEQFIILRDTSPLIRALEDVEEHRNKLVVLFFLRHPSDFLTWDALQTREARERLATTFIDVFPRFVAGVLGEFEADAFLESA